MPFDSSQEQRVTLKEAWAIIKATIASFIEDDAFRLAASVAFYASLSLAPMMIFTLDGAGRIWGQDAARSEIVRQTEHLLGHQGAQAVEKVIDQAHRETERGAAAIIGTAALLFAATAVFAGLQGAMNEIWGVQADAHHQVWALVRKRLLSLGMLAALGFLMIVSLALSSIINLAMNSIGDSLPGSELLWQALNVLSSILVFSMLFALIFKILPDVVIAWRDVWMGAAVTAVLFGLGRELIGFYLGRNTLSSVYGAAGSLVVLLLWVYYSSVILFFGAEFTQVFAHRRGRRIEPEPYATSLEAHCQEAVDT